MASLLAIILDQMYVDPDLLEELTKEQKEILFHKIREEQVRRWQVNFNEIRRKLPPLQAPAIQWAKHAVMLPNDDDEGIQQENFKKATQIEEARLKEQEAADIEESQLLAKIAIEKKLAEAEVEATKKAREMEKFEQENQKRLQEDIARSKQEAIERELYMTQKEAKKALEDEQKKAKKMEAEARRQSETYRKDYEIMQSKNKKAEAAQTKSMEAKSTEIYLSMQELRQNTRKKQVAAEKNMTKAYQEVEIRAKKTEAEKLKVVQKARAMAGKEDLKSLEKIVMTAQQKSNSIASNAKKQSSKSLSVKESGNPSARPSRPPSEGAVVQWWKAEEAPRNVGRDVNGQLQPWFHGAISRQASEAMLKDKGVGAFLIRLSTRIWGYTLSFNDSDRFKHFLIDAADGQYSVFGAQTRSHSDLNSMVQFHGTIPVSKNGTKLTKPVGHPEGNLESLDALIEEDAC